MRILSIDDHPLTGLGLKGALECSIPNASLYTVNEDISAKELLSTTEFDVILLDLHVPDMDMMSFFLQIRDTYPDIKIIFLSAHNESYTASRLISQGADAYISKECTSQEIVRAVKSVLENRSRTKVFLNSKESDLHSDSEIPELSMREIEVLKLLLNGKGIAYIADVMNLSSSTVATYKSRLFEKFRVNNIIDLYKVCQTNNLSF